VSSWIDLPDVDRFTTGTVGPPGERVFYLQAVAGAQIVSLKVEKGQVAALASYLAELLADLPVPGPEELPDQLGLVEPVVPEWTVGDLGVAFDESDDRLLLRADELTIPPDDENEEEPDDDVDDEGGADKGVARFRLTRAQVVAFVGRATEIVAAGRPPCDLCGRPLDPEGHVCIKTNGKLH
jgi:uncharacterized repeat protein (TIGR03847 family)